MMTTAPTTSSPAARTANELDHLAQKRASRKMGWYIHALVFLTVNLGLATLAAMAGRYWVVFPTFGWSLALFIHGLVVFLFMPGNGLRERMVQRERAHLIAQRDPW
jgi:hypothetical protein